MGIHLFDSYGFPPPRNNLKYIKSQHGKRFHCDGQIQKIYNNFVEVFVHMLFTACFLVRWILKALIKS